MVISSQGMPQAPVAIVGLSCRFPGAADSPIGFWDLLKNGKSGYSESTDRYNAQAFHHPQTAGPRQNVIPVEGGYFLKQDPYAFDAAFFNITAKEALALDPRQRIALEVAYEALENAGMSLQKIKGSKTSCFLGVSMSDYRDAVSRDFGNFPKYQILGVSDEMIANRISHFLDIHGPSATVQSACSSSLVALHVACQSLRSAESSMAIAGGVGMITLTDGTMHLTNLGFLNPQGHSMSFDASANGYGRGEGCGIVILKLLDQALRDGDNIRAVIKGSGVNSDGWTQGITMPSLDAQADLIKQVYESNGIDYGSVQYVEAHGTGTKVGDPIETTAIFRTIGQSMSSSRKQLYMGSLKPNIGHLEAAAGVASVIKGVLSLEHRLIPPTINFSNPNPAIPFEDWNITVPTGPIPWPAARTQRMSINGFGMGGTNGHIILDGYSTSQAFDRVMGVTGNPRTRLFVLSSHDKAGLQRICHSLRVHLDGNVFSNQRYLADLAHTLAVARGGLAWRTTCLAQTTADLQGQLAIIADSDRGIRASSKTPRIGLIFTGQGAQWARMGIELLQRPVFHDSVSRSGDYLAKMGCTWNPISELSRQSNDSRLGNPDISQPICTVLQIALVDELRSWGVIASRVVGHSSGEIGAAYAIGALSHRDAIAAAYFRGVASARLKERRLEGGMMAIGCSADHARHVMEENGIKATVACVNAPSNVTVSGDISALDDLKNILDARQIFARRLKVDVAYHSPHMHYCSGEYYAAIANVGQEKTQKHSITMVSSVTGYEVERDQLGPYYWVQNLINPVLFSDALKEMVAPSEGNGEKAVDVLIEVGPHSALGGPVEQTLAHHGIKNVDYTSMLVRNQNATESAFELATFLFQRGTTLDMSRVNGDEHCRLLTNLPSYPWNHTKSFNAIGRAQREQYHQPFNTKSLLGAMMPSMDEQERVWRSFVRTEDEPWLRDHVAGSTVVFPAAGMVSIAIEAAQQVLEQGKTPNVIRLRDIGFLTAIVLTDEVATELTVHLRPHLLATTGISPAQWWEFTISSCIGDEGRIRTNCRGLLSIAYDEDRSPQMVREEQLLDAARIESYQKISEQCRQICSREHFYDKWLKSNMSYGPAFQGVQNIHPGTDQSCYEVEIVDIGDTFTRGKLEHPFLINPVTLDAAWQGMLSSRCDDPAGTDFGFNKLLLPTYIGEMSISFDMPRDIGYLMPASCRSRLHGLNGVSSSIDMFDAELSRVVLSVADFRMSKVETDDAEIVADLDSKQVDVAEITSQVRWDYALDLLSPMDLSQAVTDPATGAPSDGLLRIIPLSVDETCLGPQADLYILDHQTTSESPSTFKKAFRQLLEQFKPNPNAWLAMTAPSEASELLRETGFAIIQSVPMNSDKLVLFLGRYRDRPLPTNGAFHHSHTTRPRGITILEPVSPSEEVQAHSQRLQTCLVDRDYLVTVRSGVDGIDSSSDKYCISLLELTGPILASLSQSDFESLRKLWVSCERLLWVTCGDDPKAGLVDGLSRCVNVEIGSTKFQVLNLSREGIQSGPELISRIWTKAESSLGNEFREEHGLLKVPRMYQNLAEDGFLRQHLEDNIQSVDASASSSSFSLTVGKPGLLDSLHYIRTSEPGDLLGDHDIEVDVAYASLNLRDVMVSMGLVPDATLGQEASGTVLRAGREAAKLFTPGDRVSSLSVSGTHATRIRCDSRVTVKVPDDMLLAEAAAAPLVFTAAYHALVNIARLRRGQSVLIHAAAGGLGQAAVQLATTLGLKVFVTASSKEKRQFLIEQFDIPEDCIFHSRDASFVKGVQRITNGHGVDCILNTLSGELLRVSFSCLATFGTFIEFGLRDITDNMRLEMRPFTKSITFTSLDLPTLITEDPTVVGDAMREVFKLLQDAIIRTPQPLTTYSANEAEQAYRTMQQGKHRGKIILSFKPKDKANLSVLCKASESLVLDPDATYLFVGGLGGLGRSLALEFVACGARHIAFLSRSGKSKPGSKAIVDLLVARGIDVRVFAADVADRSSFLSAMESCSTCMPPIKGVMQMAMVLRDVLIENMSYDEWRTPLQPKVNGTLHLHEYFGHDRPLDFMIFCSSFSGLCGSPGQAQYGAGNTYQDALAHYRCKQGLKATSVDLGIMLSVGILAEMGTHTFKQWEDVLGIREHAFHALVKSIANRQRQSTTNLKVQVPAQICLGLGTADMMHAHNLPNPPWYTDPRFKPLTVRTLDANVDESNKQQVTDTVSLAVRLADAGRRDDLDQAASIATEALVAKTAEILRMPTSEIDADRPLYLYGVDSLVALEVRNWITREMKANMALLDILAAVPIKDFAAQIAQKSKLVVAA
ncbi:t1pks [Curvularia kusanoi]|uniref:T1pks n=1 Tax=Curvularia kusanoi TaxID=90978 RepID=A0A9P4TE23_CURKU|nr:t1pks [Curvularia kusanoi]